MMAVDFIKEKRNGGRHSDKDLEAFLAAFQKGEIPDYQMSAWLMAVYFQGMGEAELLHWTELMWRSGETLNRKDRQDFWVDKHSTGGVGDKTSLLLVPWVVSTANTLFGVGAVRIPMISGRGLGSTGGTLDKLESVPGFSPRLSLSNAMKILSENGFFMMGQTQNLAPADGRIYSLRDVTGTVESISLITSSILSKKLSENIDGLVIDVKWGLGAFRRDRKTAIELADTLVSVSKHFGLKSVALVTNMNEPLGYKVGHQLEVEECEDFLKGTQREKGLSTVTIELAAWMLRLCSKGKRSMVDLRDALAIELESKRPLILFQKMFEAQGGNWAAYQKNRETVPSKYGKTVWCAPREGFLETIDASVLGPLVSELGGGRGKKEMDVDFRVGIEFFKKVGDFVKKGDPVLEITHLAGVPPLELRIAKAISVGDRKVETDWIQEVLGAE